MAGVRLHRKIVQAVTDLKWSVSLENLQRANAAREDSRASLVRALDQLEGEPPYLETVRARIALSADAWRIQEPPDWDTAQRFAQAAVDMAAALDSPVDLSQAHGALANVLDGRSRLREHLQMAEQRLAICRQPEFSDLRETLEALRGLGTALMYVGEYAQALPYLAEAEGLATRVQAVDQIANILTVQAQCLFRTDRWDEVLALEEKWRDLEPASWSRSAPAYTLCVATPTGRTPTPRSPMTSWSRSPGSRRSGSAISSTEDRCRCWHRASSPSSERAWSRQSNYPANPFSAAPWRTNTPCA
jgi:tetratricopeptide (TPR) repeat protein